jgi:hypothetical protein
MTQHKPTLIEYFKNIEDPHVQKRQLHKLYEVYLLPYE